MQIIENGATGWSVDPGGELPGSAEPLVVVRVTVPDPKAVDAGRLDALVAAAKPAHVMHRIELVKGPAPNRMNRPGWIAPAHAVYPSRVDGGDWGEHA